MKVENFWNAAFLAAMSRLPLEQAKKEADRATELCIAHWQAHSCDWAINPRLRWKDQDISNIPKTTTSQAPDQR